MPITELKSNDSSKTYKPHQNPIGNFERKIILLCLEISGLSSEELFICIMQKYFGNVLQFIMKQFGIRDNCCSRKSIPL